MNQKRRAQSPPRLKPATDQLRVAKTNTRSLRSGRLDFKTKNITIPQTKSNLIRLTLGCPATRPIRAPLAVLRPPARFTIPASANLAHLPRTMSKCGARDQLWEIPSKTRLPVPRLDQHWEIRSKMRPDRSNLDQTIPAPQRKREVGGQKSEGGALYSGGTSSLRLLPSSILYPPPSSSRPRPKPRPPRPRPRPRRHKPCSPRYKACPNCPSKYATPRKNKRGIGFVLQPAPRTPRTTGHLGFHGTVLELRAPP
jgi:hypothetical protein